MLHQAHEVSIREALSASVTSVYELARQADLRRQKQIIFPGEISIKKYWCRQAKTFTYHTHVAVPDAGRRLLESVAEIFFNAAALSYQPWAPQFLEGEVFDVLENENGCHQLTGSYYDFHLSKPRYYRQLASLSYLDRDTAIINLRSVNQESLGSNAFDPEKCVLAYMLSPSGEVLHWHEGCLHWHHICTAPGVQIFPSFSDRWLMNAARGLGLDRGERHIYQTEARRFTRWLAEPESVLQFYMNQLVAPFSHPLETRNKIKQVSKAPPVVYKTTVESAYPTFKNMHRVANTFCLTDKRIN